MTASAAGPTVRVVLVHGVEARRAEVSPEELTEDLERVHELPIRSPQSPSTVEEKGPRPVRASRKT